MLGSGYLLMKVYIVLFIYIALNHPPIVLSLLQIPLTFVVTCGGLEVAHFLKIRMLLAAPQFLWGGISWWRLELLGTTLRWSSLGDSTTKGLGISHKVPPLNRELHCQLLCCTSWLRLKWEISPQIHRLAVFTHIESLIFGQVLVGGGDAIPLGRPYPYSLHHGVSYRPLIGTFCRQVCTQNSRPLSAAHHFHLFKDLCFVYVYVYKYTCIVLISIIIHTWLLLHDSWLYKVMCTFAYMASCLTPQWEPTCSIKGAIILGNHAIMQGCK